MIETETVGYASQKAFARSISDAQLQNFSAAGDNFGRFAKQIVRVGQPSK